MSFLHHSFPKKYSKKRFLNSCLGDGFKLPKLKLKGNYSYKYFYFDFSKCYNLCTKEDFDKFNTDENKHYFKPIYLKLDIYCKEKIEDIESGKDIVLEKAVKILTD